ncbi:MAG TPA: hypothetical protein VGP24_17705 [Glaciihabitans sp.]|jgi:hypothetical protein|nr:hypothetical protein [Glaciihabitans sp.]
MDPKHRENDPNKVATSSRVRDQPALTTSSGAIWVIVGGILVAITIGVLLSLGDRAPGQTALIAIVLESVLYIGMLAALLLPAGKRRLGVMATALIAIAAVALIFIGIIVAAQ